MARVTAPLFSFDASGSIAKSIVFSRWKGRSYVRRHAIPSNPRSQLQTSVRAMMSFLARQWEDLGGTPQGTWLEPSSNGNISPFNAFIRENQLRWSEMKSPTDSYPAAEASAAPGKPTVSPTGGVHNASLSIADGSPTAGWGYLIFRNIGSPGTLIYDLLIAVVAATVSPTLVNDSPLAPATYYYMAVPFNLDGVIGTPSDWEEVTVT